MSGVVKRKFCFIICVNDEECYNECCLYINKLKVPNGYVVELLPIRNAKSMAEGYNVGMNSTDAKIKIYMHQDTFILNTNFLNDILEVFNNNRKAMMLGVVGAPKLSPSGVIEFSKRVGNAYVYDHNNVDFSRYYYSSDEGINDVEALEGFLMVTREDLPWRSDLFTGWDFADIAQAFEFRKNGYRVVVPNQTRPWCHHEAGRRSMKAYDEYRKVFLKEYNL